MDSHEREDLRRALDGEKAVRVRDRMRLVYIVLDLGMRRKEAARILRKRPGWVRTRPRRCREGGLVALPAPPTAGAPAARAARGPARGSAKDLPEVRDARKGAPGAGGRLRGGVPHRHGEGVHARREPLAQGGAPRPRGQGRPPRGRRVAGKAEEEARAPAPPRLHRTGAGRGHLRARRRGRRQVLVARGRAGRDRVHGKPRQGCRVRRAGRGREAPLPHARKVRRRHACAVPRRASPQVRQGRRRRGQGAAARRQGGQGVPARLRLRHRAEPPAGRVAAAERRRGGVAPRRGSS